MASGLDKQELELIKRLVDRLEHLSADSIYAHRASGLRGTLLRYMEGIETSGRVNQAELTQSVENGFEILKLAAEEIGGKS